MARIKLKKQAEYEFSYEIKLSVRDINYGGHMGNDSAVSLIHDSRLDLLSKMGFNELNIGDNSTGIIMTDIIVNFIDEGYLLDKIKIINHIDNVSHYSFRIFTNFIKNDKTILLAESGFTAFNYKKKQISELPEIFLKKLEEYKK